MKTLALAALISASPASAQLSPGPSDPAGQPLNIKPEDIKWEQIMPELGVGSPEIAFLHIDPSSRAAQLMIRVPKNFHVPPHWHSANETHTILSGVFIVQAGDGGREELGSGSFNYIPRGMVHQAWTKPDEGALLFITVDGPWDINWTEGPPAARK
jgi:quercetin dioxygenase-like cupin family protein